MFGLLLVGSEDPHVVRFELKNPWAEQLKNGDFQKRPRDEQGEVVEVLESNYERTDKFLVPGHFLLVRVCRAPAP